MKIFNVWSLFQYFNYCENLKLYNFKNKYILIILQYRIITL